MAYAMGVKFYCIALKNGCCVLVLAMFSLQTPHKTPGAQCAPLHKLLRTLQQHITLPVPTALDHWFFDAYNIWLKDSGNSAESKMRNRRTLALELALSFDLDHLQKAGS